MPKGSGRPPERTAPLPPPPERVPSLPRREWHPATRRWWRTVWTAPWAGIYADQDRAGLERLALMVDRQARLMDGEGDPMSAAELAAMAALEDRYGLSPRARQVLRWETAEEQTGQRARAGEKPAAAAPVDEGRRARLQVV